MTGAPTDARVAGALAAAARSTAAHVLGDRSASSS
jgi:hypothetical protein